MSHIPHFQVVSGGATGVDIAALRAAHDLGVPTGGWAAQGFWNGKMADLRLRDVYGLEAVAARGYKEKEERNVARSNGLLAFRVRQPLTGRGTESVVQCARFGTYEFKEPLPQDQGDAVMYLENPRCPVLLLWDLSPSSFAAARRQVVDFLRTRNVTALMVSGSTSKECESMVHRLVSQSLALHLGLADRLLDSQQEVIAACESKRLQAELKLAEAQAQHAAQLRAHDEAMQRRIAQEQARDDMTHAMRLANHIATHHCADLIKNKSNPRQVVYHSDDMCGYMSITHADGRVETFIISVLSEATRQKFARVGPLAAHQTHNFIRAHVFSTAAHKAATMMPVELPRSNEETIVHSITALLEQSDIIQRRQSVARDPQESARLQHALSKVTAELLQLQDYLSLHT